MHYAPEVITSEDVGIVPGGIAPGGIVPMGIVPELGIVRVRGIDAVRFLQGQLSNDVARLSAGQSILAGYHNPQGRTIALLRLVQWDVDGAAPSDILAVVPRELAGVVASRLGKFVLRAKVKIADESAGWRVHGLVDVAGVAAARGAGGTGGAANTREAAGAGGTGSAGATTGIRDTAGTADASGAANTREAAAAGGTGSTGATTGMRGAPGTADADGAANTRGAASAGGPARSELPSSVNAQSRGDGAVFVRVGDEPPRWLVISPADAPAPISGSTVGDRQTWLQLDIAAGLPQVYAATSEEFVAQMLNLDVLNAIAFDKGCYTGQEVIARAHYRGRVKRRMQRFVSRDVCRLAPGDSGQLADGRAFKVVLATQLPDGRCDFLAVAPLVGAGHDEATAAASGAPEVSAAQAAGSGAPPTASSNAAQATGLGAPATTSSNAAQAAGSGAPPAASSNAAQATGLGAPAATSSNAAQAAGPAATTPAALIADQVSLPYSLPD
jgi:folate-binding protein YgfZ